MSLFETVVITFPAHRPVHLVSANLHLVAFLHHTAELVNPRVDYSLPPALAGQLDFLNVVRKLEKPLAPVEQMASEVVPEPIAHDVSGTLFRVSVSLWPV